jgi:hypothetical protein
MSLPKRLGFGLLVGIVSSVVFLASFYVALIIYPLGPILALFTLTGVFFALRKVDWRVAVAASVLGSLLIWAGNRNEFESPGGYALGIAWIIGVLIICGVWNGQPSAYIIWMLTITIALGSVLVANRQLPKIIAQREIAVEEREWETRGMTLYTTSIPGLVWRGLESHAPIYSQRFVEDPNIVTSLVTVSFVPVPASCNRSLADPCSDGGRLTPDRKSIVHVDRPELLQVVMQNLKPTTYKKLYERDKAANPTY